MMAESLILLWDQTKEGRWQDRGRAMGRRHVKCWTRTTNSAASRCPPLRHRPARLRRKRKGVVEL